ncbi:aminopeptidase N-like [Diabrotica virgifera virgifera]|uniref:Aminopeptidase n=1 Tax=Diabrotica virgifera virgifera TaxID=50390 RepID=A0ABM5KA26_DIAVI|nr:aminopeptidase N-like [Diabrotica virgifera virgifera]XP_050507043.1 aminopeptidase N-like [Diabrotica virgifera virgifera]
MARVVALFLIFVHATNCYRLPKDVIPENYKLEIISNLGAPKDSFNFDGKVWITVTCTHPTQNITLHSKHLDIKDDDVILKDITSNDSKTVKISNVEFKEEFEFLILNLEEDLNTDHKYEIYIGFSGKMDDGLAGFYRSSYYDKKDKEKKWLGVTQFEPISARMAFPCFDEPEMKATFDISIGRKEGYTVISNMPVLRTEPLKEKDGWFWDRFDTSVPMSTYLVAWVVSDFDYKSGKLVENNNVTFRIWARKDAINQVDFATEVGPKCLEYYEKFFDIEYPLPKQDMISIPDFSAGAMENWGLITYRESYLLYDPKVSSKTSQNRVASVIAHELAHQWFGNLVTMKWWTDLWLNEGFATYMASLALEDLFPQWNSLEEEDADNILDVFSFDALRTSHPVSVPIGNPKEIDEIFDTISYKKGSSLIRMMTLFLGEEILRKGVSNYLKKHKYGNAEQDDLWEALTKEAHSQNVLPKNLTVKLIMDTWTVQTGYPVINVMRDYSKKSASISQHRHLRDLIYPKDASKPCWWVPLSYSTKSNPNFNSTTPKHWLSCPEHSQTIEDLGDENDWVIFNNKMAGIYKVNYDERNWNMITKFLQGPDFQTIPTLNRVQIISDAADLAYIGSLKYEIFFEMLKYLKQETEYMPWKAAIDKTDVITKHLKKSASYGKYKEYMRHLLTPIYEKFGGFEVTTDPEKLDYIKLQALIVSRSCAFEVANCVSQAKSLFNKLKEKQSDNVIPKDLRSAVYCTVLKHGGEAEWDFLWNKYQNSNVATEKSTILTNLGCTEEIWMLARYLDWSLNDTQIRRQDSSSVFASVSRNNVGYFIAKNYFYNNIDKVYKHLLTNKKTLSRYLSALSNQITDAKDEKEFERFIKGNKKTFAEVKKGVEQSLETVKINIQWQHTHAEEIADILNKYSK